MDFQQNIHITNLRLESMPVSCNLVISLQNDPETSCHYPATKQQLVSKQLVCIAYGLQACPIADLSSALFPWEICSQIL